MQIAYTLNLQNQLSHLVQYCGFTLLDIEYCLDHGKTSVLQD